MILAKAGESQAGHNPGSGTVCPKFSPSQGKTEHTPCWYSQAVLTWEPESAIMPRCLSYLSLPSGARFRPARTTTVVLVGKSELACGLLPLTAPGRNTSGTKSSIFLGSGIWLSTSTPVRSFGVSVIASECRTVQESPPTPEPWEDRGSYYRIDLKDFRPFPKPFPVKEFRTRYFEKIREDIENNKPERYPFVLVKGDKVNPAQGSVLTQCTPALVRLISEAVDSDLTAIYQ